MPWLARRVPDDVRVQTRRRLDAVTRASTIDPRVPDPEVTQPMPEPDLGTRLAARLPTTVRGGRMAIGRTAAAGLAVVSLAAVVLAGSYAWRSRTVEAVLPAVPSVVSAAPVISSSGAAPIVSATASPGGVVVVDVAGQVRHPGVVTLPLGSRVVDAIDAAGGVRGTVDLTTLNLARLLVDGEQVLVGVPSGGAPPAGSGGSGGPGGTADPDGTIDLNSATLEQLDTLPGVGPVLAQRILDWRTAHGRFSSIDELREVSGIGESRFADIAPHVRV